MIIGWKSGGRAVGVVSGRRGLRQGTRGQTAVSVVNVEGQLVVDVEVVVVDEGLHVEVVDLLWLRFQRSCLAPRQYILNFTRIANDLFSLPGHRGLDGEIIIDFNVSI